MPKKRDTVKAEHRVKLLEYFANPDNEELRWSKIAERVLGISKQCLYYHFTPLELGEICDEALRLRRQAYAKRILEVDLAMLRKAAKGNTAAAKLVYQRLELWEPGMKIRTEISRARELAIEMLNELGEGEEDSPSADPGEES